MARILRRHGIVMISVAPGAIRVGGKYLARLAEVDPVALIHRLLPRLVASDIPIEVAACGDLEFAFDTTHARQSMGWVPDIL